MTDIDNGQVRELSAKFEGLSLVVTEIKTDVRNLLQRIEPALNNQALGITSIDNRLTRQEERLAVQGDVIKENRQEADIKFAAIEKRFTEEKAASLAREQAAEDRFKARGDANQRLIITTCTIIAVALTVLTFAINNLHWKQQ